MAVTAARKQAQRRRGRRILLWLAGLFCLAQLASGLLLDHLWIRPRYPYKTDVYAALEARTHTPEIMFIGSSRFGGNINCSVFDAELRRRFGEMSPRAFNASLPAGDATVFERIFSDVAARGHYPKLLVLEVSPETVNRRDNWLNQHALNILDWRDVPEALPALCRNGKIMYLIRGRLLPLYVHRYHICKEAVRLISSLFKSTPASTGKSDPPVPLPVDIDPEPPVMSPAVRAVMERGYEVSHGEVQNYQPGGMTALRLERLLGRCESANITVLLVGVPVSSPYRRAYTPEVDALFLKYMRDLGRRFGCRYTDWRGRVPDRYFIDGHHMGPEGAVYFSRRLAAEMVAPLWGELKRYGALTQAASLR